MQSESITNQLLLSRYLYFLADQNIKSEQTASLFAGVNLLQDSIEAFLWAAATHKSVGESHRAEIHQLFDAVGDSIAPRVLPFRHIITQLNRLRINSKHYGITPDRKEAQRFLLSMAEFLREATLLVFDKDFWTTSLIDLVSEKFNNVRYWLTRAQETFQQKDFHKCLLYCRYAVYLQFENQYDISPYADPEYTGGIGRFISAAPPWACNANYVKQSVKEPTGFIVINHDDLHRKLWENGIDPTIFANVRRLTPEVFLPREENSWYFSNERARNEALWAVKRDFNILHEEGIDERAAYVLRHTIDMMVNVSTRDQQSKSATRNLRHKIKLQRDGVSYFQKASRATGERVGVLPEGVSELDIVYSVSGFDDDELFWFFVYPYPDAVYKFLFGFVGDNDVVHSSEGNAAFIA